MPRPLRSQVNWRFASCRVAAIALSFIHHKLRLVELTVGRKATRHALGYLSGSRYGLTNEEMLDLLSMDDEALDDIYRQKLPCVLRFPRLVWAFICEELHELITEREMDGVRLWTWRHEIISSVTKMRYIWSGSQMFDNDAPTTSVLAYHALHDLFVGGWAGKYSA